MNRAGRGSKVLSRFAEHAGKQGFTMEGEGISICHQHAGEAIIIDVFSRFIISLKLSVSGG